jgi:hypothetical protein
VLQIPRLDSEAKLLSKPDDDVLEGELVADEPQPVALELRKD